MQHFSTARTDTYSFQCFCQMLMSAVGLDDHVSRVAMSIQQYFENLCCRIFKYHEEYEDNMKASHRVRPTCCMFSRVFPTSHLCEYRVESFNNGPGTRFNHCLRSCIVSITYFLTLPMILNGKCHHVSSPS